MKSRGSLTFALLSVVCLANTFAQQSTTGPRRPTYTRIGSLLSVSSQVTIPNVPAYNWYRGCGPTSVGMVLGYWNTHGYPGLIGGNSTYQNESVDSAVASPEHYQDYSLPIDYAPNLLPDKSTLGGAHPSNSIADFMNTSWSSRYNYYGWSWFGDVGPSWVQYVSWKRPEYVATSKDHIFNAGAWNAYKEQIDQGKPVVLLVDSDGDGVSDHFVTGIGYDEVDSTYGVHDTWDVSTHWYPWIRMTAGIPWGVLGFTSFDISRNTTIVTLLAPQDGSVLGGVSIGFTWHRAERANEYWLTISRNISFSDLFYDASVGTDTAVTVNDFMNNSASYYWRVRARDSSGWGAYGSAWSFRHVESYPAQPVLLSPANGSVAITVPPTLRWKSVTEVSSYGLQVSKDQAFAIPVFEDVGLTDTMKVVSGLATSTKYYWRVNSNDARGTGSWSTPWSFTTASRPMITLSQTALSFGSVPMNGYSASQPYSVTGQNLSTDITIKAPACFELSPDSVTGFGDSLVVPPTGDTIFVRFHPTQARTYADSVSHSTIGATTAFLGVSGIGFTGPNTGTLIVEVRSIEFHGTAGKSNRVVLLNNGGNGVDSTMCDSLRTARFTNVAADTGYSIKVFCSVSDPSKIYGNEYWGSMGGVGVSGGGTTSVQFIRNAPVMSNIKVYNGNSSQLIAGNVPLGTPLKIAVEVTNPGGAWSQSQYVHCGLTLDRDKIPGYMFQQESSQHILAAGAKDTIQFEYTPPDTGHYYHVGGVDALVGGALLVTDGGAWGSVPIFIVDPLVPTTVAVTVQTVPSGRSIIVDDSSYTAPANFIWTIGSGHKLEVATVQFGQLGERFLWARWNDSGAVAHGVTASSVPTTYVATFDTSYYLTMVAGAGGAVIPASGWVSFGTEVRISAIPTVGWRFVRWTGIGPGSYSGADTAAVLSMDSVITEGATFEPANGVADLDLGIPFTYCLVGNYPNPFNPATTIRFGIPSRSMVTLSVHTLFGQRVATLVNGFVEPGYHDVKFDGSRLATGVYYYRIQAGSFVETKKLLLVR